MLAVRRAWAARRTHLQRYARNIIAFMGDELTRESAIRIAFGNTPDTSKALRQCVSSGSRPAD